MVNTQNLKSWQKGETGNKNGRPPVPEYLQGVSKLSRDHVARIVSKFGSMTQVELSAALKNPETPVLELAIATALQRAIRYGDARILNFLLDRSIGRVAHEVEVSAPPKPFIIQSICDNKTLILGAGEPPENLETY